MTRVIDTTDGASAYKHINALKAAKVSTALMYFGLGGSWKHGSRTSCDALRKAGIDVGAIAEGGAGWMLGGYSAGQDAAKSVRADVKACGGPSDCFVWLACDTDTSGTDAVTACVKGAQSILGAGKVGVYGSAKVCKAAKKATGCKMWEAQSTGWSGFVGSAVAMLQGFALFQLMGQPYGSLGMDYDGNNAWGDVGGWDYKRPVPKPKPAPGPFVPWQAKVVRNTQLWNSTIGTKRSPSPGKGGTVTVTGEGITVRGQLYRPISWGGNPGGGWVLGDDLQRVVK